MNEALDRLILALLAERGEQRPIPADTEGKFRLYRALCNVREPLPVSRGFLQAEAELLAALREQRGVVTVAETEELLPGLRLWRGDITRLAADAIVNAANSALLGCFVPLHACIDNCIHSYAGVQLRLACQEIMERQGRPERTGTAKLTPAFHLPSRYVLHTVGPIVHGALTRRHEQQLTSCYEACLKLAAEAGCQSLAFCCISTGVFRFPAQRAAELAVETVKALRPPELTVIFNVFSQQDEAIYRKLLR